MSVRIKVKAYANLGLRNIISVLLHRLGLKIGLHPVLFVKTELSGTKFFKRPKQVDKELKSSSIMENHLLYFGWYYAPMGKTSPDWGYNPFNQKRLDSFQQPWWRLSDFNLNIGDIKTVWEPSRFNWVLPMVKQVMAGNKTSLRTMNTWISDWCRSNPAYMGPNWKCGQETSIRVLMLAIAARTLDQDNDTCPDLVKLIEGHLLRIIPTLSYAKAQDNNHAVSEAVALFIGGGWCYKNGIEKGKGWEKSGKQLLEDRVKHLIENDGSFSQYSSNYHRMLLDLLCIVELWRRWQKKEKFSYSFYKKAKAAVFWLYSIVDIESGDAPNLGANDGAWLVNWGETDYRDFRPTIQLSMNLFEGKNAYKYNALGDFYRDYLELEKTESCVSKPSSKQFCDGGYMVMRKFNCFVLFRYPNYRFRPRHCDALHIDFWYDAVNVLPDSGTYSYNTGEPWQSYFSSTSAHNTIQFDDREQMPAVSRFLRGEWLKTSTLNPLKEVGDTMTGGAGYCDWKGAFHHRKVSLSADGMTILDQVSGFRHKAILRWRLSSEMDWKINGTKVRNDLFSFKISSNIPISRCEIVEGWQSLYYMKKSNLPVLEIEINEPGAITSAFSIKRC
ncbi:heparinase II/III family protein [Desulfospira joergensenii]|uniref:heparinase II/III family protein n=1 Tax=Desulfospira joergensenii TaxID=53329 RepID=UPI0003B3D2FF|nr:heparinase II/III-family protein [Desulfospira joergensenii]